MFGKNRVCPECARFIIGVMLTPVPPSRSWLPARFAPPAFLSMRLARADKRFRHVPAVHVRAFCCKFFVNDLITPSTACHVRVRSRKQLAKVTLIIRNDIYFCSDICSSKYSALAAFLFLYSRIL